MATPDRLVVVRAMPEMTYNAKGELHAASFPSMGLTSFGDTPEVALKRLKRLFRAFIDTQRRLGILEETLNRLGVEWYWEDEYPADAPPYENMHTSASINSVLPLHRLPQPDMSWAEPSRIPENELALAAM